MCQQRARQQREVFHGWTKSSSSVCTFPLALSSDDDLLPVQFVAPLQVSQVPILSSALMLSPLPPPPPPPCSFRHSSAGKHSSARRSTFLNDGWRMSNTAPTFLSPFHTMLTDTVRISLLQTLSYFPSSPFSPSTSADPSPLSFLYLHSRPLFFFKLTTDTWKDASVCLSNANASEIGTLPKK